MGARTLFDAEDRTVVHRALLRAEELAGDFYRIPGREWGRFPYELQSLGEGPGPEARVFADLVRMVPEPGRAESCPVRELYRIRLRDDLILSAVHDRPDGVELFPLLLYVLTHELVHVIRFGGGAAPFDAGPVERQREEARVHAVTREVLGSKEDPVLRRILELYRPATLAASCGGLFSPKWA